MHTILKTTHNGAESMHMITRLTQVVVGQDIHIHILHSTIFIFISG